MTGRAVGARHVCTHALIEKSATLKLCPPCGHCLVAVAVCRHHSHVSAMVQGDMYRREKGMAVARAERGFSYVHTCSHVYGNLLKFCSAFTCSVNAMFKFSNRIPLIYCPNAFKDVFSKKILWGMALHYTYVQIHADTCTNTYTHRDTDA